ncbi:hypothetical protein NEFER03_0164 [Nematocida sp. LUAm3]|nr:hypothetical protein NEFER03_0164 [Nematocida sp. LUAm3]KAI5173617.1 hypothetical protein NEFER02_0133 [Nematocida sp. LUAm2]KAI5176838.1 hypothetical protein NEFER01_0163 [Nematocida sp. LUAm1]
MEKKKRKVSTFVKIAIIAILIVMTICVAIHYIRKDRLRGTPPPKKGLISSAKPSLDVLGKNLSYKDLCSWVIDRTEQENYLGVVVDPREPKEKDAKNVKLVAFLNREREKYKRYAFSKDHIRPISQSIYKAFFEGYTTRYMLLVLNDPISFLEKKGILRNGEMLCTPEGDKAVLRWLLQEELPKEIKPTDKANNKEEAKEEGFLDILLDLELYLQKPFSSPKVQSDFLNAFSYTVAFLCWTPTTMIKSRVITSESGKMAIQVIRDSREVLKSLFWRDGYVEILQNPNISESERRNAEQSIKDVEIIREDYTSVKATFEELSLTRFRRNMIAMGYGISYSIPSLFTSLKNDVNKSYSIDITNGSPEYYEAFINTLHTYFLPYQRGGYILDVEYYIEHRLVAMQTDSDLKEGQMIRECDEQYKSIVAVLIMLDRIMAIVLYEIEIFLTFKQNSYLPSELADVFFSLISIKLRNPELLVGELQDIFCPVLIPKVVRQHKRALVSKYKFWKDKDDVAITREAISKISEEVKRDLMKAKINTLAHQFYKIFRDLNINMEKIKLEAKKEAELQGEKNVGIDKQ